MTEPPAPSSDEQAAALAAVAAAAARAEEAPDLRAGAAPDAGDAYDVAELGDDCPVTPLGSQGKGNWLLNWRGEIFDLTSRCEKGEISMLFGPHIAWLENKCPQWVKVGERKTGENDESGQAIKVASLEKKPQSFDQGKAQRMLILACTKLPYFDPKNKVRGRGAHRGKDGEIVLHCGDRLLVGGKLGLRGRVQPPKWHKTGRLGHFVYPTGEALIHPGEAPAGVATAMEIFKLLCSWTWKRGEIDAYLLLCWVAAARIGGALRVRPHGWITGPTGAGKTTLQEFLQMLMGDWGLFVEDATEAGVRQTLDQDTLAVMFDEIEAEEDNQSVVTRIVRLARLAYSGSRSVRGSTDHQAKQFTARSCFLFSSILHHELPAQDRNRIAILHLAKFPAKTAQLRIPDEARAWGPALSRRLVEQWPRYAATLARYQAEMLGQGYAGREQDTYGTLLAAGDLLLHEEAPPSRETIDASGGVDRVADWVRKLAGVLDSVRSEAIDSSERCLMHLASTRLRAAGGQHEETVRRWIQKSVIAIINNKPPPGQSRIRNAARDKLVQHGLALVQLPPEHAKGQGAGYEAFLIEEKDAIALPGQLKNPVWLAIANKTNRGIAEIYEKTIWVGGKWTQDLALIPGAWPNKKRRFGGEPEGCVLVPLDAVIDIADTMQQARDAARQGELEAAAEGGAPEERG